MAASLAILHVLKQLPGLGIKGFTDGVNGVKSTKKEIKKIKQKNILRDVLHQITEIKPQKK